MVQTIPARDISLYELEEKFGLQLATDTNFFTEQWRIRCVRFAPNCPSQNPIEDIWLQAKTWVLCFCALIPSFSHIKWMFEWFLRHTNE